jgi:hypothetical protein
MDLSHLNTEERRKIELDSLSKATFIEDSLVLQTDQENYYTELKKRFGNIAFKKLKIKAYNNLLWGSMGMQQFTNEFINNSNFKNSIKDLLPFDKRFELKENIRMGGNLFNLLGDLCSLLKSGGCYGDGTNLKNDEIVRITKKFIDDNLKEGYKMYHYIKINEPWTEWFGYQPIYSLTYLLFNLYKDEMLMICISDTD